MTASDLPLAKNLRHHLSEEAKARNPSSLKEAFKYFADPNVISLGGGLPVPSMFPFDNVTAEVPKPPFANGNDYAPTGSKEDTVKVHVTKAAGVSDDVPLSVSLQYGSSVGAVPLLDFIKKHTEIVHKVAYKDWDVILSVGNTQAWDSTLRTFTNRGDTVLAEEFTFSSASECAHGLGINIVPAKVDLNGIVPELLAEQLDNWVGPKPKLLYTIPTGQNPTGSTLSFERRKKVYEIAQKHDLIIVEDEPYYFLQMPEFTRDKSQRAHDSELTHEEFLKGLVPSFLEVDTDGRVIRLDSFSKVLAPGTRLGWIVVQKNLMERFLRVHEVSIQVPGGFSQSLVYGLLRRWGQEGYLDWLIGLRKAYSIKRDVAIDALDEYLPSEVTDYIAPEAGMFFWIKVDGSTHPKFKELSAWDLETEIYENGIKFGVQLIPGHWFVVNDKTIPPQREVTVAEESKKALYFRGTFASVPSETLTEAIKLFGQHLRNEFHLA